MATYNTLTPEIIEQLKQAAPGHILTGEEINEEMPIYGKHSPDVLLMATSTEEIAAVMKICNDNLIPVTPRGAGTGLAGGCVPVLGGVLIDTTKMKKILGYDFDNFTVTIEPGVLLQELADDCQRQGYLYGLSVSAGSGREAGYRGRQRLHQRRRHARREVRHHP